MLSLEALGAECGTTHTKARAWLSVLGTSFLAVRLPPLQAIYGKILVTAGESRQRRSDATVLPWSAVPAGPWT